MLTAVRRTTLRTAIVMCTFHPLEKTLSRYFDTVSTRRHLAGLPYVANRCAKLHRHRLPHIRQHDRSMLISEESVVSAETAHWDGPPPAPAPCSANERTNRTIWLRCRIRG